MQYTNFRSSLASLITTVFFGLSLLLPVFGVHAETATAKSDTKADGTFNCFDLFKFGSVQVNLSANSLNAVAGSDFEVKAKVENQNTYPIVDGAVYVKVYKLQDSDSDRKVNGDNLVDEFYAVKKINLAANASSNETFAWKTPSYAMSGKYQIVSYFLSADKFNLMGLPFTEDIHGAPLDFTVTGYDNSVFLDKNTVKVGGTEYRFIGIAKPLSASKPITIEATVVNKTKKDVTVPVTARVYRWAQYESDSHRFDIPQLVSIKAGEKKTVSFIVDSKEAISLVSVETKQNDAKSILDIRFARENVTYPRINFPGLTAFPLKSGEPVDMFVCAHSAGVSASDHAYVDGIDSKTSQLNKISSVGQAKIVLTLTDDSDTVLDTYEYNGNLTSDLMGFKKTFTPKSSYKNLILRAETYQNGVKVDSSVTNYSCDTLGCSTSIGGISIPGGSGSTILIVLGLILALIIVIFLKRKLSSKGMKVLAFIVLGFGAMMFGVHSVHAETVTWSVNSGNLGPWQAGFIEGSVGSANCNGGGTKVGPCYGITASSVAVSVDYNLQAYKSGTPISSGTVVRVGGSITFSPANGNINWAFTGGGFGTPAGYWTNLTYFGACQAQDYLWGDMATQGNYFTPVGIVPPGNSISVTGPVSGSGFGPYTVTGTGVISAVGTFNSTTGKMLAYGQGGYQNKPCTLASYNGGTIWSFTVPQQQIGLTFTASPAGLPNVSLSAIPSTINFGDVANLSWSSSNANVCSASGEWSGSKALSGAESVSPPLAVGTHNYSLTCTDTSACPPPTPACTIQITAGGLGGGGMNGNYSLNLGWGVGISNSGGSSPCGFNASFSGGGSATTPSAGYSGPSYMAPAGGSIGEGPSKSIGPVSAPYNVSMTADSIVCPTGTSPVITSGATASCDMTVNAPSCSTDVWGNTNCNVNGCSDTKTITCVGAPAVCGGAPSDTKSTTVTVNSLNNQPLASLDSADCSAFAGWSTDRDSGATPNDIWFFKDGPMGGGGTFIGSMTANNVSRPDVRSYIQSTYGVDIGDWHGFWYATPVSLKDGVSHSIYAYSIDTAGGTNASAWNSPKTITCSPLPTVSVSTSPGSITAGNSSTVTWSSTNATSCNASWAGAVATAGSASVSPGSTTTYTVTCTGPGGSANNSASVTVVPAATASISASPTTIASGGSSTLTWSSTGAVSCTASGSWSGGVATSGSTTVTPASNATYTITCYNSLGSPSNVSSASVTVVSAPTASLSPASATIAVGNSQTLTWTSTNAVSCTKAGAWSGSVATSGSTSVSPGSTSTYTITCTNSIGVVSPVSSATVTVIPTPTASLTPVNPMIATGGSQTLTWSSTNATACTKTGSWSGVVATSGSTSVTPAVTSTYTITCTNSVVGSTSAPSSTTVTVAPAPTLLFWPDSSTALWTGTNLNWAPTNATACTASGDWSGSKNVAGGVESTGIMFSDKTYTLVCTNPVGSVSRTVTVNFGTSPACSDGLDNDGDGKTDYPTDPGCTDASDATEPDPAAATVTVNASPSTVTSGNTSTISWTSTGAVSCTATGGSAGWAGAKAVSGSWVSGSLSSNTTFTMTCVNSIGVVSAPSSATVTVTAPPAPVVTISATPTTVTNGGSTTITWSTTGATSCSAPWTASTGTSGSQSVTPPSSSSTTYTMTCVNSVAVPDSKSVTISTKSECEDGIDNDGDGKTDYPTDPDCPSNVGVTETTTAGFTVSVSPNSVPIKIIGNSPATSQTSNVSIGVSGTFNSPITFSAVATLPSGVTATYIFSPTNVSTFTAGGYTPVTLKVKLSGNVNLIGKNPVPVTITGVGGGLTITSTFNLNPNVAPDFREI
jgi:hypothetical protein